MPAIDVAPFAREGLAFRPWRAGDLDRLAALVSDAEVMARVGGALRADEVAGLLDRYLRADDPRVLVALCASDAEGEAIGSGLLTRTSDGAVEVGFLVRRDRWGLGHGTRIARALVALARERFPGAAIVATAAHDHHASLRVLEKAGLAVVGRSGERALLR